MFRALTAVVLLLFVLIPCAIAEEASSPQPVKVRVSVSGPDSLGAEIQSHLAKELEAQENLSLTKSNPHWILQVVALELECPREDNPSVLVSVLVLEPFQNTPLQVFLADKLDDATVTAIGRLTSGLFRLSSHWIETAPPNDLEGLARDIVSRLSSTIAKQQDAKSKTAPMQE